MPTSLSLVLRAVLALVLLLGFYALAVGLGGLLLYIPIAELLYLKRLDVRIAAVCLGAGGSILWSLRPRVDRFDAPGPRLDLDRHPRLATVITDVATATGQTLPDEVYLVPDVNAFVAQRGGVMGIGSRRVMGLGLPLLTVLSVDEFKAVLAHEFGHYFGGDVALGPLVYRTRAAIGRTIAATRGTFFEMPFTAYGRLFLRTSAAVSRHQEFVADGLAAKTMGAAALAGGLRQADSAGRGFPAFVALEFRPVVQAGFLPPITEGFRGFMATAHAEVAVREEASDYDSHPPLLERLAAIGEADSVNSPGPPAIDLLDQPSALEAEVFGLNQAEHINLKSIGWDAVADRVYTPYWRAIVQANAALLRAVAVDQLPTNTREVLAYTRYLRGEREGYVAGDALTQRFIGIVSAALIVRLLDQGWTIGTALGGRITAVRADERLLPAERVGAVVSGKEPLSEWVETCRRLGLEGPLE